MKANSTARSSPAVEAVDRQFPGDLVQRQPVIAEAIAIYEYAP
jgi:hypothetical protein